MFYTKVLKLKASQEFIPTALESKEVLKSLIKSLIYTWNKILFLEKYLNQRNIFSKRSSGKVENAAAVAAFHNHKREND